MFKLFSLGVVLGLAGAVALLYLVPAVDLEREASIVSVQPNGGTVEQFHVALPGDRIMAGQSGQRGLPDGLEWPDGMPATATLELFKVRDAANRVVGLAGRVDAGESGEPIAWSLHLPARGTMYIAVDASADEAGQRRGELRGGTLEFAGRRGRVTERFVAAEGGAPGTGRIELATSTVSAAVAQESDS